MGSVWVAMRRKNPEPGDLVEILAEPFLEPDLVAAIRQEDPLHFQHSGHGSAPRRVSPPAASCSTSLLRSRAKSRLTGYDSGRRVIRGGRLRFLILAIMVTRA